MSNTAHIFHNIDQKFSLDSIALPAFALKPDGKILALNKDGRKLLGISPTEKVRGEWFGRVFEADMLATFESFLSEIIRRGAASSGELDFPGSDGTVRRMRLVGAGTGHDDNSVLIISSGESSSSQDHDELLMLRQEARAEQQQTSRFLMQLSYQFQEPVKNLHQITELALRALENNDSSKLSEYLHTIQQSTGEIRRMAEEFSDYAVQDQPDMVSEKVLFSMEEILNELYDQYAPIAWSRGLEFYLRNEINQSVKYVGDPRRIKHILSGLVSFSIEQTSEGQVDLIAREDILSDYLSDVTFEIRDSGPGIDPRLQQELKLNVDEATSSSASTENSSGLFELRLIRQLAGILGGRFYFETARHMGSSFFFNLAVARSADFLPSAPQLEAPPVSRLKLVFVNGAENSSDELIHHMLTEGHTVLGYSNQDDLRSALKYGTFDAMILDLDDGALNAIGFLAELKERHKDILVDHMAIIGLCNNSGDWDSVDTSAIDSILQRPVPPDSLRYQLYSILG